MGNVTDEMFHHEHDFLGNRVFMEVNKLF